MGDPASAGEDAEHPLEHAWCFWEHRKGSGGNYGSMMHPVGEFQSVENFWRFKNNMPNLSDLFFTPATGARRFTDREIDGFSMFKSGIRPEWEDKANMHGAEFYCRQSMSAQQLDTSWEKILLGLIGEQIDPADECCGVRCVDKSKGGRATYRLEVWFRSREDSVCNEIRQRLQTCLGANMLKDFSEHNVSMTQHGGSQGNKRGGGGGGGGGGRNFR